MSQEVIIDLLSPKKSLAQNLIFNKYLCLHLLVNRRKESNGDNNKNLKRIKKKKLIPDQANIKQLFHNVIYIKKKKEIHQLSVLLLKVLVLYLIL